MGRSQEIVEWGRAPSKCVGPKRERSDYEGEYMMEYELQVSEVKIRVKTDGRRGGKWWKCLRVQVSGMPECTIA